MKPLYKKATTGKTQIWEIHVKGDSFRTIAGQLNGKLTTSEWTICYPKNEGKVNETSANEQALKEAKAKWDKKVEKGYSEDLATAGRAKYFEPMLAHKWDDFNDTIKYPVATQPKLDGIRCITTKDGMFSRNGKDIISAPHIKKSLKTFFEKYPSIVLDGELYSHELKKDFNKIISLVKKTKPTAEELIESEKIIEYWIYDMVDTKHREEVFSERFANLKLTNPFNEYCIEVPTLEIQNENALDGAFAVYVKNDFEGQIIRNLSGVYENKRTKLLLKRKDFMDSEFVIKDVIEGTGGRTKTAGFMEFETIDGKPFKSNIKGTFEYLAELLKDRNKLIGKMATIKYFNLTPDGVPRFPFVVAIRDYE